MLSRLVLIVVFLVFLVPVSIAQVEFEIQAPSQAVLEKYKPYSNTTEAVAFWITVQIDTHCAILEEYTKSDLLDGDGRGVCVLYDLHRDITYLYVAPLYRDVLVFRDDKLIHILPHDLMGNLKNVYVEVDPAPGDYEVFFKHYNEDETKVIKFTISD